MRISNLFTGFVLLSLALSAACGEVIVEPDWEDEYGEGTPLEVFDGQLQGVYGPIAGVDGNATMHEGFDWEYGRNVMVWMDQDDRGTSAAFVFIDMTNGFGTTPEPGVVHHVNNSEVAPVILDETGDSYVRVDDEATELRETEDVYVMVCATGLDEDGQEIEYDEPADEVLMEVVETDNPAEVEVRFTTVTHNRDDNYEIAEGYEVQTGRFIMQR